MKKYPHNMGSRVSRAWSRCTGVVYAASPFHVLCARRADKTGLCKMHRKVVAEGKAAIPCGCGEQATQIDRGVWKCNTCKNLT